MLSAQPCFSVNQILSTMVRIAAEHHRAGRTAAARTLYLEVLAMDARHADALYLLGVMERQTGRLAEAQQHLREALRWAADRRRVEAELRAVERLLKGPGREVLPAWAPPCTFSACSALPMMARA